MTVTRHDVDHAIEVWLRAESDAARCRSVSDVLLSAERYGCRITGGRPPEPRLGRLVAAERPLQACTGRERQLLRLRYANGGAIVVERIAPTGQRTDYLRHVLTDYASVGREMGITARQARELITLARKKIRRALDPPR